MAKFALGQHHPGQESAKRRAQSYFRHQNGNANHQEECSGGKNLPELGSGDKPEYGRDNKTSW